MMFIILQHHFSGYQYISKYFLKFLFLFVMNYTHNHKNINHFVYIFFVER